MRCGTVCVQFVHCVQIILLNRRFLIVIVELELPVKHQALCDLMFF